MRALTALLLVFACPAVLAADPVALECERLFDARTGRVLGAHTIVVEDGKVVRVLPGTVAVPGTTRIGLADRTCLPGWTDLHVHMGQQSGPQS